MTYVITQSCCNDASCVPVCPVGCIHPAPGTPEYATAEMLYIDPGACIDCGACVDVCPVAAIKAVDELGDDLERYADINAAYFAAHPTRHQPAPVPPLAPTPRGSTLRVAIVGAGPTGFYAAQELLSRSPVPVEISLLDRLPTPFGLVRGGVAPDHQHTKAVTDVFRWVLADPRVSLFFNTEVGRHVSHEELLAHHHALVYTHGASGGRHLGVPGEQLDGSLTATEFVGWYNAHPDHANHRIDLDTPRATIVGNGNVALDIARVLLCDPDDLARTDVSDAALEALRRSRVEEVMVLGRRDARESAFTTPELLALEALDIDIRVEDADVDDPADATFVEGLKLATLRRMSAARELGRRRLVLRYRSTPVEVLGDDRVTGLRTVRSEVWTDATGRRTFRPGPVSETIETGLLVRSVGYRGERLSGLPFDEATGTVPHLEGRVRTDGAALAGVYVGGWAKRGATGVIGTNRADARQTVTALLADLDQGSLARRVDDLSAFEGLVRGRQASYFDRDRWKALDAVETGRGRDSGRPRTKISSTAEMLRVAPAGRTSTDAAGAS